MEEKTTGKTIKMSPSKTQGNQEEQKLSYEDLNNACAEMSQQLQNQNAYIQKMYRHVQEMEVLLQSKRMDYLFKVVELSNTNSQFSFDSEFVHKCIEEIKDSLTVLEEDRTEEKE